MLTQVYPELRGRQDFCKLIWDDLNAVGVISSGPLGAMMSAGGAFEKRTTGLGDQFLAFITDPLEAR
jgi:hypothetical protein